jgi:2-dehydro-3-deoxy-L-rhamnonate dehydrogenase (NAD+)
MNIIDLKGRTAIVTGGARGIGFAIAQRMAKSGAKLMLWDLDRAAMNHAARPLQDSGSGLVYVDVVDVTDETSVGNAAAGAMRIFGKIDILVNNAGIGSSRRMSGGRSLRSISSARI